MFGRPTSVTVRRSPLETRYASPPRAPPPLLPSIFAFGGTVEKARAYTHAAEENVSQRRKRKQPAAFILSLTATLLVLKSDYFQRVYYLSPCDNNRCHKFFIPKKLNGTIYCISTVLHNRSNVSPGIFLKHALKNFVSINKLHSSRRRAY